MAGEIIENLEAGLNNFREINQNQVNLFLGSGFSVLAKNRLGKQIPTGSQFTEILWNFIGYPPPYDPSSSLAELYEALLTSGKPVSTVSEFLTSHLFCSEVPQEYDGHKRSKKANGRKYEGRVWDTMPSLSA